MADTVNTVKIPRNPRVRFRKFKESNRVADILNIVVHSEGIWKNMQMSYKETMENELQESIRMVNLKYG